MVRAILFDLKPHSRATLDLAQLLLNRVQEIAGLLLVNIKIAVASNAKEMRPFHLHSTEKRLHMRLDDVSQKNIVVAIHLR